MIPNRSRRRLALLRAANFVDTAELYGEGAHRGSQCKALKTWRGDEIYVATRAQPTHWPNPGLDHPEMRWRYPRWHLR
jgi:hypothetical protein